MSADNSKEQIDWAARARRHFVLPDWAQGDGTMTWQPSVKDRRPIHDAETYYKLYLLEKQDAAIKRGTSDLRSDEDGDSPLRGGNDKQR